MAFALVGHTLEHYEILGPLGAGAMSEVYLARDTRLDKQVAVKVINENLLRRPDLVERFEREARAAARLSHANVATVYFFGRYGDKPFYAMELIRGWSLGELVEGRVSFTWDQALGLLAQACTGLQAAAEAGITHRDIKPGNLMTTESGVLKIVDFGLAKLGEDKSLTRSGAMMGTPYYIAPEVVQGQGGDHLADIYSLGVTFFHVLAGRPPYDAETPYGVMMQHISEPTPSLLDVNARFPSALAGLVTEMMSKQPQDRPQSYALVGERLRDLADAMAPERRRAPLSWCAFDKTNTTSEAGRCAICRRPRGVREVPESFHVDLVGWHRNDALETVAAYIGKAVGQPTAEIRALLDPLPFRAAFRVPRERARKMQRTFYELGADVSLVPSDEDGEGRRTLKELPFKALWPQRVEVGESLVSMSTTAARPRVRGPKRRVELSASTLIILALGVVILVLLGVLLGRGLGPEPAPGLAAPAPTAPAATPQPTPTETQAATPTPSQPDAAAGVEPEPEPEPEASPEPQASTPTPTEVDEGEPFSLASERFVVDGEAVGDPSVTRAVFDALGRAAVRVEDATARPLGEAVEVELIDSPHRRWRSARTNPGIRFPVGDLDPAQLDASALELVCRSTLHRRSGGHAPAWLEVGLAAWFTEGAVAPAEWQELVASGTSPTELTDLRFLEAPQARKAARAFSGWLLEEYGWQRVTFLLDYLSEGQELEVATRLAFRDRTFGDLEQTWFGLGGAGE